MIAGRLGQPAKFVLVGTGGFLLNLAVFAVLVGGGVWYLAASVLAYLLSNAAMYLGNRYFTFGLSHEGILGAYARYVAVGAVVAALTAALLACFVEGVGLDPRAAQALALTLLVPLSFALSKRFAFGLRTPCNRCQVRAVAAPTSPRELLSRRLTVDALRPRCRPISRSE